MRHFIGTATAVVLLTHVASAQTLENRIATARGSVAFEFATRPNVCGDGSSISVSDDSMPGWTVRRSRSGIHIGKRNGRGYERCEVGPARVLLRRSGNSIVSLRVTVGGRTEQADTELGEVPPADAARYLLDVAPRLPGESADDAVMGAQIAEGANVWRRLLQIARDNSASEAARKASVFWVSHEAGVAATAGLDSIAVDDDINTSVRADAIFYLAQRPHGEGIPALVKVVETSKSKRLRKDAIFYLAQSRDSRALELFERLLTGR
jgi:hypothetical protein